MNVGYVRLSKDDDKRNYVSIENQKLIINQFAATNDMVIDEWYEDDGVSGYKFTRPAFSRMLNDLDTKVDTVIAKDFSRIGRHNAKVLLLIDEFQERGKRLIVIDDNYDSLNPEDDVIGIKTWYNEKYVKDTSKKVKRVLGARQKAGTLMTLVPFGYIRSEQDKEKIEVVEREADIVKMLFKLYIEGLGYRKISGVMNEKKIPTPSMLRREREVSSGKISKRSIATEWSDAMIKDILGNDFYIGNYRLHKRSRATVHGKDKRVPRDEQFLFENHHPAIINKVMFDLVQELKEKRMKSNYRGSRGQWIGTEIPNPFGTCLYCKDCGSRLTPIVRKTTSTTRKYYVCSTYNSKGRHYCSKAHLIEEKALMKDVYTYITLCRDALCEMIHVYDMKDFESEQKSIDDKRNDIKNHINEQKKQLKSLITQKVKDLTTNPEGSDIINESYDSLQNDILAHIHSLDLRLKELNDTKLETPEVKDKLKTALEVVDQILQKEALDRRDIEMLVERITVSEDGVPDIELKYGLSRFVYYNVTEEMNRRENEIIRTILQLLHDDERGYTSARYLSIKLTEAGYKKTKKSIVPYIQLMIADGVLEPTENALKPYIIIKTPEEIEKLIKGISIDSESNTITDNNLHGVASEGRHAADGI